MQRRPTSDVDQQNKKKDHQDLVPDQVTTLWEVPKTYVDNVLQTDGEELPGIAGDLATVRTVPRTPSAVEYA